MASRLVSKDGKFERGLYASLNQDDGLLREIMDCGDGATAAANGNVALRFALAVFQSITLLNSTRLPASPADKRTTCLNFEPSVSRTTSTPMRTGPSSITFTFAAPPT